MKASEKHVTRTNINFAWLRPGLTRKPRIFKGPRNHRACAPSGRGLARFLGRRFAVPLVRARWVRALSALKDLAPQGRRKTMWPKLKFMCVFLAFASVSVCSWAVQGVSLSFQGNDVVLRWPSQPNQRFIVGYRPAFGPATPWTLLATSVAASAGTETTYVHAGAFQGGGGPMMALAAASG